MSVQKVVSSTDTGADLIQKYNANADEQIVSATSNGQILSLNKSGGGAITCSLNVSGGTNLWSAGTGSNSIKQAGIATNAAGAGYSMVTGKINVTTAGATGSAIIGGQNNTIYSTGGLSFIGGGIGSRTNGLYSFMGGGSSNIIRASSNYSSITGGLSQDLSGTANFMVGGYSSIIKSSAVACGILGGINNQINTSVSRCVVLGGHHISGATTDSVYVPSLYIWNGGINYYTGGTNSSFGTVTLTGGTATVSSTAVKANSMIFLTQKAGGTPSTIWYDNIVANTSFIISGSSLTNTSEVSWIIVNKY
jgi:hypothetical protein